MKSYQHTVHVIVNNFSLKDLRNPINCCTFRVDEGGWGWEC